MFEGEGAVNVFRQGLKLLLVPEYLVSSPVAHKLYVVSVGPQTWFSTLIKPEIYPRKIKAGPF